MSKWFSKHLHFSLFIVFTLFFPLSAKEITHLTSDQFESLKSANTNAKYPSLNGVKGILTLKNGNINYLPARFENHFDYCKAQFSYPYKLYIFNRYNYTPSKERTYICFNLYQTKPGSYVIEFSIGDKITVKNLKRLHSSVKKSIDAVTSLQFLCNTEAIRDSVLHISPDLILSPSALFKSMPFQIIHEGEATGILKRDSDSSSNEDIILIEKEFISPPIGSAYIVTKPITPLSHIAMLAHSQKAPLIYVASIDSIRPLIGEPITLRVFQSSFHIQKSTSTNTSSSKHNNLIKLEIENTTTHLKEIADCSYETRLSIGHKAANFAELAKLASDATFKVPEEAFAITFTAYEEHISASGLMETIQNLTLDTTKLSLKLSLIRDRIKREPLNKTVVDSIITLQTNSPFEKFRFRSSSNAEDIDGFSGAGLYRSKSASKGDRAGIEKAIKTVWASLWSERAFRERARVGIDQNSARMGILVHRSFPEEKCNGVAITENLFNKDAVYGYTFNVQLGDIPVVTNDTTHRAELFISYFDSHSDFYNRINSIDYITYSSLTPTAILTEGEVKKLTLILKDMERYFYKRWHIKKKLRSFSIDIEFKTDTTTRNNPKLYIKQVRPY